jgi:hypothetical protein
VYIHRYHTNKRRIHIFSIHICIPFIQHCRQDLLSSNVCVGKARLWDLGRNKSVRCFLPSAGVSMHVCGKCTMYYMYKNANTNKGSTHTSLLCY